MMQLAHTMPFGAELRDDGVAFRLWAPARRHVGVVVDGREHAMEPRENGWFARALAGVGAGARYAFRFPGVETVVPDPASRFQPDGVHAPSEVIAPSAYRWQQRAWRGRPWHETVLYELHVGTFTPAGTYAAARARLDELVALGVTAVELMPLAQPAGTRNWGYDGVQPFAPQHAYGRPEELKAFVDAAHARGISVFLDVVYNHFGPEGNYLHLYAPEFFTERHHTPWGAAINVDGEHAATVREFFIQNALYWLREYRFDGLRLDAVHEIRDDSPRPFLDELAARVRAEVEPDRHVHLVLENDANDAGLLGRYDAQWNDDAHHAFHVLLTGEHDGYYRDFAREPARHAARALAEGFAYQGERSEHRGKTERGTRSAGLPATAFVNFLQNHDQVGNRAFGERISALAPPDALDAATAVLLLAPAVPLLFMGEEWAASTPFLFFSNFGGNLGKAVTAGRRREFGAWPAFADPALLARIPDPELVATMRASTLRWDERGRAPHARVLAFVRALLALRRERIVPLLAQEVHSDGYALFGPTALRVGWHAGERTRLTLLANLGPDPATYGAPPEDDVLFAVGTAQLDGRGLTLGPWSVRWYLRS